MSKFKTVLTQILVTLAVSMAVPLFVFAGFLSDSLKLSSGNYTTTFQSGSLSDNVTVTGPIANGTMVVSGHTFTGDVSGTLDTDGSTALAISGLDATKIGAGGVSSTEFGYLDGVTSSIQTQFAAKQNALVNSAGLASALSDETGTGLAVFATSPTLTTPNIGAATGTSLTCSGAVSGASVVSTGTGSGAVELTNTGNYTLTIQPSASQASNQTYTMPPAYGTSGQVLGTTGSGVLGFVNQTAGSTAAGNDNEIQYKYNSTLAASPLFTFNQTSGRMTIGNSTSGRGGILFGDAYNATAYKTGFRGASNATANYTCDMPDTPPSNTTAGVIEWLSDGTENLIGSFVTNFVKAVRSIATSGSLTGGGNLSADRTISLVNDNATPGNSKYYGTDSGGTKGFFDLPTGGTGNVTYANVTEVNTGTETAKAVNPDTLAGSNYGTKVITVSQQYNTTLATGTLVAPVRVPAVCNGWNVVAVGARVWTNSTSGNPTFCFYRNRAGTIATVTSTNLTIDANESDSSTAATAAVVDTNNDDVNTGDLLYVNCTSAGTATAGTSVDISLRAP